MQKPWQVEQIKKYPVVDGAIFYLDKLTSKMKKEKAIYNKFKTWYFVIIQIVLELFT